MQNITYFGCDLFLDIINGTSPSSFHECKIFICYENVFEENS